jgi:hypothetical protein
VIKPKSVVCAAMLAALVHPFGAGAEDPNITKPVAEIERLLKRVDKGKLETF